MYRAAYSWFVALQLGGEGLWLVCGAMVAIGLLLVDRGVRVAELGCSRLAR